MKKAQQVAPMEISKLIFEMRMKVKESLMSMFVVAGIFTLASCSDTLNQESKTSLTLSTNIVGTRNPYNGTNNSAWEGGETVMVHVEGAQDADEQSITDTYPFIADAQGNLTPKDATLYWPDNGIVKVYAYYANDKTLNNWSIQSDQSIAGNLAASDFLYATSGSTGLSRTGNHALTFSHQVARINIKLQKGDNTVSDDDFGKVKVVVYGYSANKPTIDLSGCTWPTSGTLTGITPNKVANGDEYDYTVLLPPGTITIPTGSAFFEFTLNGTRTKTSPSSATNITIEAGKSYTYTVKITDSGFKIIAGPTVAEWIDTPWSGTMS
jgi:hypothetical protein